MICGVIPNMNDINRFIGSVFWLVLIAGIAIALFVSKPLGVIFIAVGLVSKMNTMKIPIWSLCGAGVFLLAYGILYADIANKQSFVTPVLGLIVFIAGMIIFKKKGK